MADTIVPVASAADFTIFGRMIRDYVAWCRDRHRDDAWFVDQALAHQSIDHELAGLADAYAPPGGRAFLARRGDVVTGCGAYHRLGDGICELKRVYVPGAFRGHGTGRQLCATLLRAARSDGYTMARLDTSRLMTEAIALYGGIGFKQRPPYQTYPDKLMPYLVFMEMPLNDGV